MFETIQSDPIEVRNVHNPNIVGKGRTFEEAYEDYEKSLITHHTLRHLNQLELEVRALRPKYRGKLTPYLHRILVGQVISLLKVKKALVARKETEL